MASLTAALFNMIKRRHSIVIGIGLLVASSAGNRLTEAADPEPSRNDSRVGTIEGVVIYQSDPKRFWRYRRYYVADRVKGHLAEAVVSLVGEPPNVRPAKEGPGSFAIDQKGYRFIPETLAVRAGDRITFTNSDPLLHDVTTRQRSSLAGKGLKQDNFSLRQRQEVSQTYTDAGGIERPVTLSCRFHSGMGNLKWESAVEVKSGETQRVVIRVSPDHLRAMEK
jgi:plastocyanin